MFADDAEFRVFGEMRKGRQEIHDNIGVQQPGMPPGQHVTYNSVIDVDAGRHDGAGVDRLPATSARTATGTSISNAGATTTGWCASPTGGASRPARSCSSATTRRPTRERPVPRGLVPAAHPAGRDAAGRGRGWARGRLPPLRGDAAPRRRARLDVDARSVRWPWSDVPGGGRAAARARRHAAVATAASPSASTPIPRMNCTHQFDLAGLCGRARGAGHRGSASTTPRSRSRDRMAVERPPSACGATASSRSSGRSTGGRASSTRRRTSTAPWQGGFFRWADTTLAGRRRRGGDRAAAGVRDRHGPGHGPRRRTTAPTSSADLMAGICYTMQPGVIEVVAAQQGIDPRLLVGARRAARTRLRPASAAPRSRRIAVDRLLRARPRRDDEAGDAELLPPLDVVALVDRAAEADLERRVVARPYSATQLRAVARWARRPTRTCGPCRSSRRRRGPRAAARPRSRPPTRIGGHGCCTGLGSNATASNRKNSPSCATSGSVHSRLHTSSASSTRRPRVSEVELGRVPLLLEPAGADAELEPPAGDDVEGLHGARRDERMAQPEVVHVGAEPHALGRGRRGSRGR